MKNQMHNILEAVNRGIRLALDDYEDIEDNNQISKQEVIQNDETIIEKIRLHDLVRQLAYYVAISEEGLIELSHLAKKYGYKYKVKDTDELKRIVNFIGSTSYFTHTYEFNQDLLRVDLNFLDVSGIKDMGALFKNNYFNGDISQWDVSNVTNMWCMFNGAKFNGDISQWDVSNVETMAYMFENSQFNQPIGNWNVQKNENFVRMFQNSPFCQDISKWNCESLKNYDQSYLDAIFSKTPMYNKFEWYPEKLITNIYKN